MTTEWNAVDVKAQLRLTSQRLGQLQQKKDSDATVIRGNMATLIRQGNIPLARTKAQNLLLEDAKADLLGALEMYLGSLVEHFSEINPENPSPVAVEGVSSIIYAAPQVDSKDLLIVRDLLAQRMGPDFTRSAVQNSDNHVPQKVLALVSAPAPSPARLNQYLYKVAVSYNVNWVPEPQRRDLLVPISELLDPQTMPSVDIGHLRHLCGNGIPDGPGCLRPRIWKLLFSTLPLVKSHWDQDVSRQRESYYDLVRRLLTPFQDLPTPTNPLAPSDVMLLEVYQKLARIPSSLLVQHLAEEPDMALRSPLDANAPSSIRIACANALDKRLAILRHDDGNSPTPRAQTTPEIRLESDSDDTYFAGDSEPGPSSSRSGTTLLASHAVKPLKSHENHTSSLLRLLFVHTSINPGNFSPHICSLLAILYYVCLQEIESSDLAHAEADTFWLFEAMIGEFSELEDEEGGSLWMKRLSSRLAWADPELHENLNLKGLDPALPHYSYRWMAPLLTQTLPLPAVLLIWDVIFAQPIRERDVNYKLETLLNICTAMLIRVRTPLLRSGKAKAATKTMSLWGEDSAPPPSPLRSWEYGDAFLEAMSTLETYPLDTSGGVDRILQTASDLAYRLRAEARPQKILSPSLGERLKVSMWKGFTNQATSPELSPEEEELSPDSPDEGNDTETPKDETGESKGITSRLASSVWRGITNQSSMDVPPTPLTPIPPSPMRRPYPPDSPSLPSPARSPSPSPSPSPGPSPSASTASSLWSYADKLRDSDTAAQFAKVSSNLRAKGILGSFGIGTQNPSQVSPASPAASEPPSLRVASFDDDMDVRRNSLPLSDRLGVYSPPPRPSFFRPPRDSVIPSGYHYQQASEPSRGTPEKEGFLERTKAALIGGSPNPKAGPRPLLLNSSSLITAPSPQHVHQRHQSEKNQWSNVNRQSLRPRDSTSSVSSFSESSGHLLRPDWDSDTGSRRVSLNRRSVSPMAPSFRLPATPARRREASYASGESDRSYGNLVESSTIAADINRPQSVGSHGSGRGWSVIDVPDSPTVSSPPPDTPGLPKVTNGSVHVVEGSGGKRNSDEISSPELVSPSEISRPKFPPVDMGSDSSASEAPAPVHRSRSKRRYNRPPDIRTNEPVDYTGQKSGSNLVVDSQLDPSITPTVSSFDPRSEGKTSPISPRRSRKVSTESRQRKISTEGRQRKVSSSSRDVPVRSTESAAEEGDDEGYDDLLSAYESEQ